MPRRYERKWSGWGHPEKSFELGAPSAFWRFLDKTLGPLGQSPSLESLDDVSIRASRLSDDALRFLKDVFGEEHVSTETRERVVHSFGKSYPDLIRLRSGDVTDPTDAVVYPGNESQIETLLELARQHRWIVIPFGGGTSVVGGLEPPEGAHPVVTVDLARLNRVLDIDSESRLATVECGIFGPELERQLNASGYTLGHFPQSFEFSTLGGWIATRSAGQCSTKYGKIEHLVQSLRLITPGGVVETANVPAAAAGSDLLGSVVGSEGTLGVLAQATVRLQVVPSERRFPSFLFPSFEQGVAALRAMVQMDLGPAVVRLSDDRETELSAVMRGLTVGLKNRIQRWRLEKKGLPFPRAPLLILGFESGASKSERRWLGERIERAKETVAQFGGHFVGERPGKRWYRQRFDLPYFRDVLLDRAVMVDTLETATTWKNLLPLHRSVQRSLIEAIEKEEERPLVLTHVSHAYSDGASLYYTFLSRQKPSEKLETWRRVKQAATETILQNGGALSHHHGIGTHHKAWMPRYLGDQACRMLRALKTAADPDGVMNPGPVVDQIQPAVSRVEKAPGSFSWRTRAANLERFVEKEFDLAIVGGGITGSGIARDAALRGMSVALIDKGDFASGTSSRSSKMIHGGLRYLKQLDLKLVKEALKERELLLRLAPHLVKPAAHLIPSYKGQIEKLELQIGMMGYDALAGDKSVAPYRKLSRDDVFEREPLLEKKGLSGGFLYYDCLVNDARLTLATVKSASEYGAAVANYVECVGLEKRGGTVAGLRFRDVVGGLEGTLRAKVVVNATGSWADSIRNLALNDGQFVRPTRGIHIVVAREKLHVHHVLVLFTRDHRTIFVAPRGALTYVGTTDTDHDRGPDEVHAETEDVRYLLRVLNEAFAGIQLDENDVLSTWAGLRPLANNVGTPSSISRDYRIETADCGLVSIAGGKLTTHRSLAETVVNEILKQFSDRFNYRFADCQTTEVPLFGGEIVDFEEYARGEIRGMSDRWGLTSRMVERLLRHYGTDYLKLLALGLADRELLRPLTSDRLILKGEVVYAVEDEMAMTLRDFMARRTELTHFDPDRGMDVAESVARIMGRHLQWGVAETKRQVEDYRRVVDESNRFRGNGAPKVRG